jgi:small conductance mechanosensitive channel
VTVRVRIKTTPGMQWAVGRAYNRLVKRHLEAAGIEIPFPHTTLYFGQNKDGSAPAANVRRLDSAD